MSNTSPTRGRNRVINRTSSSNNIIAIHNNPIGLSRIRQQPKASPHEQLRERRSQSLTRFIIGGSDGGDGDRRRRSFGQQQLEQHEQQQQEEEQAQSRQRSSSLSSFRAIELNEPGWFSHAFHGSGACTCSLLVGTHDPDHHPDAAAPHDNDDDSIVSESNNEDNVGDGNDGDGDTGDVECKINSDTLKDIKNEQGGSDPTDGSGEEKMVDEEKREEVEDVVVCSSGSSSDPSTLTAASDNGLIDHKNNDGIVNEEGDDDTRKNIVDEIDADQIEGMEGGGTREGERVGVNSIQSSKLQQNNFETTTTKEMKEWHVVDVRRENRHDQLDSHELSEVVNIHPASVSDEPSLLSSSSSLSSSSCISNNINDELVAKVGDLAEENGFLLDKCNKLEHELTSMLKLTTQQEESAEKAMIFMAAISTTMIDVFRLGNENLLKLSSFLSNSSGNSVSSFSATKHPSVASSKPEQNRERSVAATTSPDKAITEMKHEEVLEMIRDMQAENDVLHKSINEAVQLVITGSSEKLTSLVETNKTIIEGYTSKMNVLEQELHFATSAKDLLAREMIMLKNDNINLTLKLEEAVAANDSGDKIAALSEEINELSSSTQELSREMELLRKENQHLTNELEVARSLLVTSVHEEIKQELLSKDTRNDDNEEQVAAMDKLKKENERLYESEKELKNLISTLLNKVSEESALLKDAREFYEQQVEELNVEKMANTYLREEITSLSTEREEAYEALHVLQQEINLMRRKLATISKQMDNDDSTMSSDDSKQDKLSELTRANETLTIEVEQKNEALQSVQSLLKNLKEEQSIIKKTIDELRTENAALRDSSKTKTPLPPPPPKSTLKHKLSSDGSSDSSTQSQITQLEVRLKNVEKENKGLREANSIMSTKLFDEMEKTESLKIANEGLGARICKLVDFIQQNSGASNGAASALGASSHVKLRKRQSIQTKLPVEKWGGLDT